MKHTAFSLLTLMILATTAAHAEDGIAFGTSIGFAHVEDREPGFDIDDDSTGAKIFGIVTFENHFGIEGGYVDFGRPHDDYFGLPARIDAQGFYLSGIAGIPLSRGVDLFGKAGVISWTAESTIDNILFAEDDGNDLALGVGVRIDTDGMFGMRAEFEWFDVPMTEDVWMASIGLLIRF